MRLGRCREALPERQGNFRNLTRFPRHFSTAGVDAAEGQEAQIVQSWLDLRHFVP